MLSDKLFKTFKKSVYQPRLSLSNGQHPIRLASTLYVLAGLFCLTACASAAESTLNVPNSAPSASPTANPLASSSPTAVVVYLPSPVSTAISSAASPVPSANEVSPSPTTAAPTAVPIVEPSPEPTPSQISPSPTPVPIASPTPTALPVKTLSPSDQILMDAFKNKTNNLQVQGSGSVSRILADDNDGSRHQRFIVKLASGQTLLVAHNIDLAPKITTIKINQPIEFFGEYEWNDQGGVIHWTHKDPQQKHIDGWLKYQGTKYE